MVRNALRAKASVTSAAASALQAAIATDPGPFELHVKVHSLPAAKTAVIAFEDTVDDFSAAIVQAVFTFKGPIVASAPVSKSIKSSEMGMRAGTSMAELREALKLLTTSGPVVYESWIESEGGVTVA